MIAWLLDGPEGALRGAAAGARRGQARRSSTRYTKEHSAEYQAQAWIDLARSLGAQAPGAARPGERRVDRARDQPPHALRDRLRRERPAEVRPDRQPRDARPLGAVHLHGRAAGRRLGPRDLLRPGARRRAGHRRAVAQGHHRRGPGVDPPLPLQRPGREGVRRPGRDRADRRPPIVDEIAVADAHPLGARPFTRPDYVAKFRRLAGPCSPRRRSTGSSRSPSACPS